jgi:hypothetical protein
VAWCIINYRDDITFLSLFIRKLIQVWTDRYLSCTSVAKESTDTSFEYLKAYGMEGRRIWNKNVY